MTKIYGIETLKKAVAFGVKLGTDVGSALTDGKIAWNEYPMLLGDLMGAGDIIGSGAELKQEVLELDADETAQLETFIVSEFPTVTPDNVKAVIAASVHAVAGLYDLYLVIAKK